MNSISLEATWGSDMMRSEALELPISLGCIVLAVCPGIAQSAVTNGRFDDALSTGWTVRGDNVERRVYDAGNTDDGFALFTEPGDPSEGSGGTPLGDQQPVAAIWQDFTIPADPVLFSFRYRFVYGTLSVPPGAADPIGPDVRPPDSFTVWLGQQNSAITRLIGSPASGPPDFSQAIFYVDSNGALIYDPTVVTLSDEPDGKGLTSG